jgi:hypothetical protein
VVRRESFSVTSSVLGKGLGRVNSNDLPDMSPIMGVTVNCCGNCERVQSFTKLGSYVAQAQHSNWLVEAVLGASKPLCVRVHMLMSGFSVERSFLRGVRWTASFINVGREGDKGSVWQCRYV